MQTRLIPLAEVVRMTPYSKSTIWLKVARGEFPTPLKLPGVRSAHWLTAEVDAHVDSLIAGARGTGPEAPNDGAA